MPSAKPALFSGLQIIAELARLHPLVAAVVAGCVIAPVAAWPFLSYAGFCFEQKRFLSDSEYFAVAISQINGLTSHPIDIPGGYKYVCPIPYKDVAAFRMSNPSCCKFVPPNSGLEVGHISFLDRLLGYSARSVHLAYTLNYLDEDGHAQSVATAAQMAIGNCGQVLNTAGRI